MNDQKSVPEERTDRAVDAIVSMTRRTQAGVIDWALVRSGEVTPSQQDINYFSTSAFFGKVRETVYQGSFRTNTYEIVRVQEFILDVTTMPLYRRGDNYRLQSTRFTLRAIDGNGETIVRFPEVEAIGGLFDAVQTRVKLNAAEKVYDELLDD